MAIFIPRYAAPAEDNKYYYSEENPYVKKGYGLPNCTCYACGRYAEINGSFVNELPYGNAENWYVMNKQLPCGKTPKLGAIICWQKGEVKNQKDGAGHVGIVEAIAENGDVTCSMSDYSGKKFYTKTFKAANGYYLGTKYTFQGFIYQREEQNMPTISHKQKDKSVNQLQIIRSNVRVRLDVGLNGTVIGHATVGYYNVYESVEKDNYTWHRCFDESVDGFNAWMAEGQTWSVYIPKTEEQKAEEKPSVDTEKLEKELANLKAENIVIKTENDNLKAQIETLKTEKTALVNAVSKVKALFEPF